MKTWRRLPVDIQHEIIKRYPQDGPMSLAREFDVTETSLARAIQRLGVKYEPKDQTPTISLLTRLLKYGVQARDAQSDREAEDLLGQGYDVYIGLDHISLNTHARQMPDEIEVATEKDYIKLGVISDTHFGSRHQQPTPLKRFMDSHDVDYWLHCGDIVQGVRMYRGWEVEAHLHTADLQREAACELYPRTGKPTYIISGNHDQSFLKGTGYNIVQSIASERDDITFLGNSGAFLTIGGVRIYIWHPAGGSAYAKSFKMQKQIEGFSGGLKPDIVIAGHWHFYNATLHRNVHGFNVPCWQAQTPYELERSLYPDIGGLIIEVWRENNSLKRIRHEYWPVWVPREADY